MRASIGQLARGRAASAGREGSAGQPCCRYLGKLLGWAFHRRQEWRGLSWAQFKARGLQGDHLPDENFHVEPTWFMAGDIEAVELARVSASIKGRLACFMFHYLPAAR